MMPSQPHLEQLPKKCSKPNHDNQPILMICYDEECRQNLLCCCSCIDDEHKGHQICSLRKFEKQIQHKLQRNNDNVERYKIMKQFEEYRSKFIDSIKLLQNALISRIHSMQQQINQLFTDIHHSLTMPAHYQIVQNLLHNTDADNWARIFGEMEVCTRYNFGSLGQCKMVLDYEIGNFQNVVSVTEDEINSALGTLEKEIKKINFNSDIIETPPFFHPIYKSFDLSRLDNEAIIERKKNNSNRTAALGSRPFDLINNTVKFNIIKNGDGIPSICVGAAILNILKKNNFANCTGNKRGVYCIDQASTSNWGSLQPSNEATFWNHDIQQNGTIGFQFGEGDVVEVTIDFENSMIIFQMGEEMFDMEIDCSHRDLYPFVSLSNSNAIVQILE